jgi:hypothetical protein
MRVTLSGTHPAPLQHTRPPVHTADPTRASSRGGAGRGSGLTSSAACPPARRGGAVDRAVTPGGARRPPRAAVGGAHAAGPPALTSDPTLW